jgi:hypothetical protein
MAKPDLIAKLETLGVTTTGVSEKLAEAGITPITGDETNKVLEELIDKVEGILGPSADNDPQAPAPSENTDPVPPTTPPEDPPVTQAPPRNTQKGKGEVKLEPLTSAPKSGSVDIVRGNSYVRTFSEEVHGEDYFDLAQQFVGKEMYAAREYKIFDSALIPEVLVLYREKEDADKPLDQQSPDALFVDKERKFDDKEAALSFNIQKKGAIVFVPAVR